MGKRRVVITGVGILSPAGITLKENWENIVAGKSGIGFIDQFDVSAYPSKIAGSVKGFEASNWMEAKEARKMDRFIQLGIAAGVDAWKDSGLDNSEELSPQIGCYIGSGIGGISTVENTTLTLHERGQRRVSPFYVPSSIINMVSGHLSIMYNLKGPNLSMVTACTTGTHAIGEASRLIEYGDATVMLAGGTEAPITPTAIAGFGNARALTSREDDPTKASRPWDVDRDGFVIAEGAAVVVLEEYEHAKKRGARIYCELSGFGMSGDAYHMTSPSEGGEGAARCMDNALRNAGLNKTDVHYVNAHGTSTPLGDIAETLAVRRSFADHADKLMVSSTKSMVGHLLGAAGAVEAVYSAMAIYDGTVPPTINIEQQDPECDLDYVPNEARSADVNVALSNSFGFGGTNGTLVFSKV